jgi:hypothetical protein
MKRFSDIFKLLLALILLGGMFAFGMAVFFVLLCLAVCTSIYLSFKRGRVSSNVSSEWQQSTSVKIDENTITIIEGEAEDVTAKIIRT